MPPEKQYYFLKLIPFRPSFPRDITSQESEIMNAHVAYWSPHVEAGTMIAMGPVATDEGGWGMGVIGVESRDALDALLKNDPAMAVARWETFPMMGIKYKNTTWRPSSESSPTSR